MKTQDYYPNDQELIFACFEISVVLNMPETHFKQQATEYHVIVLCSSTPPLQHQIMAIFEKDCLKFSAAVCVCLYFPKNLFSLYNSGVDLGKHLGSSIQEIFKKMLLQKCLQSQNFQPNL